MKTTSHKPATETAAEIIGNSAASFAKDFGRAPLPGESCEQYTQYLRRWKQEHAAPVSTPSDAHAAPVSTQKPESGIEYLRSVIRAHSKAGNISIDALVGALEQAAEEEDGAAAIEEAEAEAHRMLYPEEYAEDDRPLFTGREVNELIRQAEIETAKITASDIVRLFALECFNAAAVLQLCAVAAKFNHQ